MYKVTKLKYIGETSTYKHEAFTHGKEYYLRPSKDGRFIVLTTNTFDKVITLSPFAARYLNQQLLSKFEKIEDVYFKNYKEFRKWLFESKKTKF
jgi:hypothetical protein